MLARIVCILLILTTTWLVLLAALETTGDGTIEDVARTKSCHVFPMKFFSACASVQRRGS